MKQNLKKYSTHELLPLAHEIIQSGRKVVITVSGDSMRPFIAGNRDKVLLGKAERPKKGDVILFRDKYGEYILHRIYRIKDNHLFTIGDYCLRADGQVEEEQIIGMVEAVIRKGKKIPCSSLVWRLYSFLWLALLPLRKYLILLYQAYLSIKPRLLKARAGIVGSCLNLARNISRSGKRGGWFSKHD